MPKKLKPVIRYTHNEFETTCKGNYPYASRYVCFPDGEESRKQMIDAMAKGMCSIYPCPAEFYNKSQDAEAALNALIKLAEGDA